MYVPDPPMRCIQAERHSRLDSGSADLPRQGHGFPWGTYGTPQALQPCAAPSRTEENSPPAPPRPHRYAR